MNKLPEDLINDIIMLNNHPCADLIKQDVKDEHTDDTRECDIIRYRVVCNYSGRNVKKLDYTCNETKYIIMFTYD